MQFAIFLLPASIFAVGTFVALLISGEKISNIRILDWFVEALAIGVGLLIIPMVIVGVWFDELLDQVVYTYFALSLVILAFYTFKLMNSIGFIQRKFLIKSSEIIDNYETLNLMQSSSRSYESLLRLFVTLILISYTIINFMLPERGWDALHFYFPHSLYYFFTDDIPTAIDPLNFLPAFKPPTNVLLLTYGWYVSKNFAAYLIPILFIIGIAFLSIHLAELLKQPHIIGLLSALLVLTSPLMYMIVKEYIYYQELSLTFFYSISIIYLLKYLQADTLRQKIYLGTIVSISLAVSVLSKISGITVFLVIIIVFPIFSKRYDWGLKSILLVLLAYFLFEKVARKTYIGTGIVVLLVVCLLLFSIYTETNTSNQSIFYILLFVSGISVIVTITWAMQLSQIEQVKQHLLDLYYNPVKSDYKMQFTNTRSIKEAFYEHSHSYSFVTSAFIILFSQQFNFLLFPFKLIGMKVMLFSKKKWQQKLPIQWLFGFYILWLTYHSVVSSRYLSVIIIPLSYITAVGIVTTLQHISNSKFFSKENQERYSFFEFVLILVILGTNILMYYPVFPLENVFLPFNERLYYLHTQWWKLIIYGMSFLGIIWFYIKAIVRPNKITKQIFKQEIKMMNGTSRKVVVLILALILLFPIFTEGMLYAYSGFDLQNYQETFVYDNRRAVRELSDYIVSLDRNIRYVAVGVNIPGLEYFTGHPFLDLFLLRSVENVTNFFAETNITKLLINFADKNIDLVITTLPENYYYSVYASKFVPQFPFLNYISEYFNASYQNSEFAVYNVYYYS